MARYRDIDALMVNTVLAIVYYLLSWLAERNDLAREMVLMYMEAQSDFVIISMK